MARKAGKERLDKLLVASGMVPTRAKAQAYIMAGEVRVNGEVVTKAGMQISAESKLEVAEQMPFVSRGGYKLDGAIAQFGLDVTDAICADVGACTGGFTDVLLQKGAAHVFAIDVGYGQLDWRLRQDERVTVLERTNARYLESLAQPVSFVVIDVSFISLKLILPAVQKWVSAEPQGSPSRQFDIVALIKPQFEAGKKQVGKGGIVRDHAVHQSVLQDVTNWAQENNLYVWGLTLSSIVGAEGNIEFLVWLRGTPSPTLELDQAIAAVLAESG